MKPAQYSTAHHKLNLIMTDVSTSSVIDLQSLAVTLTDPRLLDHLRYWPLITGQSSRLTKVHVTGFATPHYTEPQMGLVLQNASAGIKDKLHLMTASPNLIKLKCELFHA